MIDTAQQIVTQVAHGDFAAVEQRLADAIKPFIPVGAIQATWQGLEQQFTMYPGLNHLFMPVEGGQKATPATYTVAGHVAEEVVNEIGNWIKWQSKGE